MARPALAARIRRLRKHFGESTIDFGARFLRGGRIVEDWEQGRRTPDPLAIRLIESYEREAREAAKPRPVRARAIPKKPLDFGTASP